MKVFILGICGTFMGGVAALAKAHGHQVAGCDANVYPPMSTQLAELGIELMEGYEPAHVQAAGADVVVVGNTVSRGNAALEYVLDNGIPYTSGPQWLADNVLRGRKVLGVAGTHGKTTTASMAAWILEYAGKQPGFLIGGVLGNFNGSARLGEGEWFVVEADEYDTAFCDKRSKFVHYRPTVAVLNNLEFDHADIFPDLAAIERQFHHLLRIIPQSGTVLSWAADQNLERVLEMGCWSQLERFGAESSADWRYLKQAEDGSRFDVCHGDETATVNWSLIGDHNVANAVAACAATHAAGVPLETATAALGEFANVKRRMEVRAEENGVTIYDDFAHHPTAIKTTVAGLRAKVGGGRILAVLEPRSNSMRMGAHSAGLADSLTEADAVWMLEPENLQWPLADAMQTLERPLVISQHLDDLVASIAGEMRPGDHVLVMSNGGFGGIHEKLQDAASKLSAS